MVMMTVIVTINDINTIISRYLQTLNSISAEKNSTIIFPLPMELVGAFTDSDHGELVIIITTISITCIIITTRPKPAYGRQGLAGSWGQDTDQAQI